MKNASLGGAKMASEKNASLKEAKMINGENKKEHMQKMTNCTNMISDKSCKSQGKVQNKCDK